MQTATAGKVQVQVGPYDGNGTFLGRLYRFTGREVGSYTNHAEASNKDDRGTDYTLYACPMAGSDETGYRVHVYEWSRWQGECSEAYLWPTDEDGNHYVADASEALDTWPELFAALGMPDIVDLD